MFAYTNAFANMFTCFSRGCFERRLKLIKDDTKINLLNIISTKTVSFDFESKQEIPIELLQFNPKVEKNRLTLSYDKSKVSLSSIINIFNKHNIVFLEMSTYESNLENVFTKLISSNGNN